MPSSKSSQDQTTGSLPLNQPSPSNLPSQPTQPSPQVILDSYEYITKELDTYLSEIQSLEELENEIKKVQKHLASIETTKMKEHLSPEDRLIAIKHLSVIFRSLLTKKESMRHTI